MPGARISKRRKIVQKSYFYSTIKLKFFIILFEIRKCCLFLHTTIEFIVEIMKIVKGHLNKKFHMKKILMNLPVIKREK
jgi:hypothetical protein